MSSDSTPIQVHVICCNDAVMYAVVGTEAQAMERLDVEAVQDWDTRYNPISDKHLTAYREGKELWIDNGPFFCEIRPSYFGWFWRHYVWFSAARRLKRVADRCYATVVPEL